MVPGDYGECKDCEGPDTLPFVLVLIVLFIVLCIIYYVIDNENHATQPQSMLLVGIVGSMMITTLQQMGVFSFLSIDWENPYQVHLEPRAAAAV